MIAKVLMVKIANIHAIGIIILVKEYTCLINVVLIKMKNYVL